jgi:hypothetical protein
MRLFARMGMDRHGLILRATGDDTNITARISECPGTAVWASIADAHSCCGGC